MRLKSPGWGTRWIADALGCSRTTVRQYVDAAGWIAYRGLRRDRRLEALGGWLADRFRLHRGNCDVMRQDLAREHVRGGRPGANLTARAPHPIYQFSHKRP